MQITIQIDSLSELDELRDLLLLMRPSRNTSVEDVGFMHRTSNCLMASNISTVEQLVKHSATELLRVPNLGRKALNEIREELRRRGLYLRGDAPHAAPEGIEP